MSSTALNWAKTQTAGCVGSKALLLLLADYADENHSCFPGQRRLASELNVSDRTVRRYIDDLERLGLLSRTMRFRGESRGRTSDRFVLSVAKQSDDVTISNRTICPVEPVQVDTGDVQVDTGDRFKWTHVSRVEPPVEPPEEPPVSVSVPNSAPADRDAVFFEIWRRWPNQTGKHRAWQEFRKRYASGARDPVIAACITAGDHFTAADIEPRFVKQLGNWLAANEWRDWTDGPPPGAPVVKPDRAARDAAIDEGVARVFAELEAEGQL